MLLNITLQKKTFKFIDQLKKKNCYSKNVKSNHSILGKLYPEFPESRLKYLSLAFLWHFVYFL